MTSRKLPRKSNNLLLIKWNKSWKQKTHLHILKLKKIPFNFQKKCLILQMKRETWSLWPTTQQPRRLPRRLQQRHTTNRQHLPTSTSQQCMPLPPPTSQLVSLCQLSQCQLSQLERTLHQRSTCLQSTFQSLQSTLPRLVTTSQPPWPCSTSARLARLTLAVCLVAAKQTPMAGNPAHPRYPARPPWSALTLTMFTKLTSKLPELLVVPCSSSWFVYLALSLDASSGAAANAARTIHRQSSSFRAAKSSMVRKLLRKSRPLLSRKLLQHTPTTMACQSQGSKWSQEVNQLACHTCHHLLMACSQTWWTPVWCHHQVKVIQVVQAWWDNQAWWDSQAWWCSQDTVIELRDLPKL